MQVRTTLLAGPSSPWGDTQGPRIPLKDPPTQALCLLELTSTGMSCVEQGSANSLCPGPGAHVLGPASHYCNDSTRWSARKPPQGAHGRLSTAASQEHLVHKTSGELGLQTSSRASRDAGKLSHPTPSRRSCAGCPSFSPSFLVPGSLTGTIPGLAPALPLGGVCRPGSPASLQSPSLRTDLGPQPGSVASCFP